MGSSAIKQQNRNNYLIVEYYTAMKTTNIRYLLQNGGMLNMRAMKYIRYMNMIP